ncbi:MAG: hypothetical protein C0485_10110 [Pirellula sp.]|nr:hypothetical protein [Pirellula sp.]
MLTAAHAAATHTAAHAAAHTAHLSEGDANERVRNNYRHRLVGFVLHDDPATLRALCDEGSVNRARLHRVEQVDRLWRRTRSAFAASDAKRSGDLNGQKQQSKPRRSGAFHSDIHSVKEGNAAEPIRDPPADAGRPLQHKQPTGGNPRKTADRANRAARK